MKIWTGIEYILKWIAYQVWLSAIPLWAGPDLHLTYPPDQHRTTAAQIFLIGSAPVTGKVLVNGTPITRSAAGHFAPSFPLAVGENRFAIQHQAKAIHITVHRLSTEPPPMESAAFRPGSLRPSVDLARLPGELLWFSAAAPPTARVVVKLGDLALPLLPRQPHAELPPNKAVLTGKNQPVPRAATGEFEGCFKAPGPGQLGRPRFELTLEGHSFSETAAGNIAVLTPGQCPLVRVSAKAGVARTGPGSDFSRLTPLPQGTQASVTGWEGVWLRLDYGGWIHRGEVEEVAANAPPQRSLLRSVHARAAAGWTEVVFPLQVPVPVRVDQSESGLRLTLYNTVAQTDTIRVDPDSLIAAMNWQQSGLEEVCYELRLKSHQAWGYALRYEGSSLVLALRHPPSLGRSGPLSGARILLDPGHGGEDQGSRGPTGFPEKEATLRVAHLLRQELESRGATVRLTRSADEDVPLQRRADLIAEFEPALALSLHYNALLDDGDAEQTQGLSTFWYNPQDQVFARFLHDHLTTKLKRRSFGVYWDNLVLTRPSVCPSVLIELGFMTHPTEFEWVINAAAQRRLAKALADGLGQWLREGGFSHRPHRPSLANYSFRPKIRKAHIFASEGR